MLVHPPPRQGHRLCSRGHLVEFTPVGERAAEPRAQAVDECSDLVYYNPYKMDTFQVCCVYHWGTTWQPIHQSDLAHLDTRSWHDAVGLVTKPFVQVNSYPMDRGE